mmetsp:Transcript_20711/g.31339  ORF Transcript_20711/g.31339 Transcript_20711/m.31339 type:complete len:396 (-) Transcript_20711:904-2091(-)
MQRDAVIDVTIRCNHPTNTMRTNRTYPKLRRRKMSRGLPRELVIAVVGCFVGVVLTIAVFFAFFTSLHNQELQDKSLNSEEVPIVLGGLIKNGVFIRTEVLTFLVQMSCLHHAKAHVVVATHAKTLKSLYEALKTDLYPHHRCVPLVVEVENSQIKGDKRIDHLRALREYQRTKLRKLLPTDKEAIVMLLDLDLIELPPTSQIKRYGRKILKGDVDVLCAAGIIFNKDQRETYYDSFATIFLPDTFMHPLALRKNKELRPEEDPSLVLHQYEFAGVNILNYIKEQGRRVSLFGISTSYKPVPVKSCFGGLALYRASVYFDEQFSYEIEEDDDLVSKYGNFQSEVCEHVTLHTRLHAAGRKIAIQPDLRTRWHNGKQFPKSDNNLAYPKFKYLIHG